MKGFLKAYYYRLVRNIPFWLSLGAVLLISVVSSIIIGYMNISNSSAGQAYAFSASTLLQYLLNPFRMIPLVIDIIIIFFLGADWHFGTMRNLVLSGKNRLVIYFSGLIIALTIYLAFFVITLLPMLILNTPLQLHLTNNSITVTSLSQTLLIDLFWGLAMSVVAWSCSYMVHNRGIALAITLGLAIFFQVSNVFVPLFEFMNSGALVNTESGATLFLHINELFPDYQVSLGPTVTGLDQATVGNFPFSGRTVPMILNAFGTSLFVSALFGFFGGFAFLKRDMK
jgi:hypothetical protein